MVSNKTLYLGCVCAFLSAVIVVLFWDQSFSSLNVNISMDPNESIVSLASVLIAGSVILFLMRFVIDTNRE